MKNKKGQNAIVGLIIGIILMIGVAISVATIYGTTQQQIVTDFKEQFTKTTALTSSQTFTLTNSRPIESTMVVTNLTSSTTLNFDVDDVNGRLIVNNGTGTINATYNYYPAAYINNPVGRIIVGFIAVFIAIGVLSMVAAFMRK